MRVILDTSALFYPRALEAIDPAWSVVLPAVAFLERARQLHRQGRMAPEAFRALVLRRGWRIEAFDADLAVRSPAHALADASWRRLARDALIASHVQPGDRLWTANPRDFRRLGVPEDHLVDVATMRS